MTKVFPQMAIVGCIICTIVTAAADTTNVTNSNSHPSPKNAFLPAEVSQRMQDAIAKTLPEPVNCWGVALWVLGFTDQIRPASNAELLNFMDSKACRKLEPSEGSQAGDVGSFYSEERGIFHSFIYVDNERIFEKPSPYADEQSQIISVNAKFGEAMDLRSGCKLEVDGKCSFGAVNYRCDFNRILDVKNDKNTVVEKKRRQMRFLLDTLHSALSKSSDAARNEAFSQYTIFVHTLLDSKEGKPFQLLGLEGSNDLATLFGLDSRLLEKLSTENVFQLNSLMKKIEKQGSLSPRTFADFPQGHLPISP